MLCSRHSQLSRPQTSGFLEGTHVYDCAQHSQLIESDTPGEGIGSTALRKANRRLLPLFALGYGVAFFDRANVNMPRCR